jgi:signal transduction histidine kinase
MLDETLRAKLGGDRAKGLARSLQSFSFWIMFAVGVGLAEFLAGWLTLAVLRGPGGASAFFWSAAGVAAGILTSMGPGARLPVLAGTLVGTFFANILGDRAILSAIIFAISNAVEAVLISELIHRYFSPPARLDSLQHVMGFVAAAAIGAAVSGIGLTAAYYLFLRASMPPGLWTNWFAGHLVGAITVAPLLIGIFSTVRDPPTRREFTEGSAVLIAVAVLSGFVIRLPKDVWTDEVMIATIFPLMLWIAARCAPVFAAAASFIWAVTIVWTTMFGIGVFDPGISFDERVYFSRAVTLAVSLGALVIAALFAERRRQEAVLLEARKQAELANRAKSNFLAAASRDLRQPLQSLMLLQRTLTSRIRDDEASALVTRIGRSANAMKGILDALLDINRLEALVPDRIEKIGSH